MTHLYVAAFSLTLLQPQQSASDATSAPSREYPSGYPDEAKSKDPRRPGVSGGSPKNQPPIRAEDGKGKRWPVSIGETDYFIEVWATNQPHIMSMAFLPDGSMLVAERRGKVRRLRDGMPEADALYEVPDVHFKGDCGLMSMCLPPDFSTNHFVYLYYGDTKANDCKVVRLRLDGDTLLEPVVILEGIPLNDYHAAGVIAFGPDGMLYIAAGDCWKSAIAQDPQSLGGKFLRVRDDGTIPSDNPFFGKDGYRPEIFALGTRNAQGMDWQPTTNAMFTTEHGPSGEKEIREPRFASDEFNLVTSGANLGWPIIHAHYEQEGLVSPLINFKDHTVAPGSGMFYTGSVTPALTGNYFVGCLRAHAHMRIELDGSRVLDWTSVTDELGRIRALAEGPLDFARTDRLATDNLVLYFASSNTDRYGGKGPLEDRIFRRIPSPPIPVMKRQTPDDAK
jgi:quinoprotein glucose dehydrogenase